MNGGTGPKATPARPLSARLVDWITLSDFPRRSFRP